jgi:hypothetical protein
MVAPLTRFWPLMIFVLVSATAFALGIATSYADTCSALKSQMLSAGRQDLLAKNWPACGR